MLKIGSTGPAVESLEVFLAARGLYTTRPGHDGVPGRGRLAGWR